MERPIDRRRFWWIAAASVVLLLILALAGGDDGDGGGGIELVDAGDLGTTAAPAPTGFSTPTTLAATTPTTAGVAPATVRPTTTAVPPPPASPPAPPAASVPPAPPPASTDAVEALLAQLVVGPEHDGGYDRDDWPHWSTQPDGCSTRERVLIDESRRPAQVDPYGCRVLAGDWRSAYDGEETEDPGDLDVDHLVPLAEAHRSGGWAWDRARREAFANDLGFAGSLVAVSASSNRSKGDKDPASWQPSLDAAWCGYATDWVQVKVRWGLTADQAEATALRGMLRRCTDPVAVAPAPAPPPPAPAPTPPAPAPAPAGCDPSYPTICVPPAPPDLDCGDIPQYAAFPVLPPDPHGFDGNDQDGLGCEGN